jgi:hypothetical protein
MAHPKPRCGRQCQQALDGTEQGARITARKIGARRAVIMHEKRIAHENIITYPVADTGGCVARRMDHLNFQGAKLKVFPVAQQKIEIAAFGLHIIGGENRAEDALHILEVFTDGDLPTAAPLDVWRRGQMIRMGMGTRKAEFPKLTFPSWL